MAFILFDTNSGVILNSIVVDEHTLASGWEPPAGQSLMEVADKDAVIGWIWNGTQAVNPVAPQITKPISTPPSAPTVT